LVEYVETLDRYVRTLDELLSCKNLQEGGFPGCFGADNGFFDRERERGLPPFAPTSKVLEPFGRESERLSRAGSDAP